MASRSKKIKNFEYKKSAVKLRALLKKHKKSIVLFLILAAILGGVYYLGYEAGKKSITTKNNLNTTQTTSNTSRSKLSDEEKLKRDLERAKRVVENDLKKEKITKEQSEILYKKIDEIYTYQSDHSSNDDSENVKNKREEWSSWAKDHGLSSRYFIPLY